MINKKFTIPKPVIILLSLSIILNIARVLIFHSTAHIYILWNIFLAFLPLVVSLVLLWYANKGKLTNAVLVIGGIVWLLLVPNAPYIVTDLIHIGQGRTVPELFDAFVIFSSAFAGLIMAMYSISHIDKILSMRYNPRATSFSVTILIFLISVGMYLGRFLRWNSWDVFTNPLSLYEDVKEVALYQPAKHGEIVMYIGLFFVFVYMSYMAWKYIQTEKDIKSM